MVDVQTISIVLTGLGIIGAIIYYTLTLRNANKTRQAQLFMNLHETYMEESYQISEAIMLNDWQWNDYDDFMEKYGYKTENYGMFAKEGTFLEAIGVLVNRGMIDVTLVDDLMSGSILKWWEKFEPVQLEIRERFNWPQNAEWVEYLYHQIKPIAERQHPELKT